VLCVLNACWHRRYRSLRTAQGPSAQRSSMNPSKHSSFCMYYLLYYLSTLHFSHTAYLCEGVDWIHLARDLEQRRALVNIVMNLHYHHQHWHNSPFWAIAFLRRFCQIASGFHFFGFRNDNICLQSKVVTLASNPQPGGPGPCIYVPPVTGWPSYTPTHRVSF
jgi:hypothetical protein